MNRAGVFLSFKFKRDNHLRGNFYAQAARGDSRYYVQDESLREDYPNDIWLSEARERIRACDIVIVLVGQDTHNSSGVQKEVTEANMLHKPIFQIMPQRRNYGKVRGAGELIEWHWDRIDAKIGELMRNSEVANSVRVLK